MYVKHRFMVIHLCAKFGKPMSNQKKLWAGHESAQTDRQTYPTELRSVPATLTFTFLSYPIVPVSHPIVRLSYPIVHVSYQVFRLSYRENPLSGFRLSCIRFSVYQVFRLSCESD